MTLLSSISDAINLISILGSIVNYRITQFKCWWYHIRIIYTLEITHKNFTFGE